MHNSLREQGINYQGYLELIKDENFHAHITNLNTMILFRDGFLTSKTIGILNWLSILIIPCSFSLLFWFPWYYIFAGFFVSYLGFKLNSHLMLKHLAHALNGRGEGEFERGEALYDYLVKHDILWSVCDVKKILVERFEKGLIE